MGTGDVTSPLPRAQLFYEWSPSHSYHHTLLLSGPFRHSPLLSAAFLTPPIKVFQIWSKIKRCVPIASRCWWLLRNSETEITQNESMTIQEKPGTNTWDKGHSVPSVPPAIPRFPWAPSAATFPKSLTLVLECLTLCIWLLNHQLAASLGTFNS